MLTLCTVVQTVYHRFSKPGAVLCLMSLDVYFMNPQSSARLTGAVNEASIRKQDSLGCITSDDGFCCAATKAGDDKTALEAQEIEVMSRTAAAGVQVLSRLESTRAVCDCMAAIMSGDLIPKPSQGAPAGSSPQPLPPSERLLPLSPPSASPGSNQPEWVADLLVAVLQRAGQS